MILSNGILRPGKIREVCSNGEIKAFAPGLFSQTDDTKTLPPIYPFFGIGGQHANIYSDPKVGDDIWVLNLTDNERQLYWFRRDDFSNNNTDMISGGEVEVLCNRGVDGGYAQIFFTNGDGWVINNQGTFIQLLASGDINIIAENNVFIGDGAQKTAARAEDTMDTLTQIWTSLQDLSANLNMGSIMSGAAAAQLTADIAEIPSKVKEITSKKTWIR